MINITSTANLAHADTGRQTAKLSSSQQCQRLLNYELNAKIMRLLLLLGIIRNKRIFPTALYLGTGLSVLGDIVQLFVCCFCCTEIVHR